MMKCETSWLCDSFGWYLVGEPNGEPRFTRMPCASMPAEAEVRTRGDAGVFHDSLARAGPRSVAMHLLPIAAVGPAPLHRYTRHMRSEISREHRSAQKESRLSELSGEPQYVFTMGNIFQGMSMPGAPIYLRREQRTRGRGNGRRQLGLRVLLGLAVTLRAVFVAAARLWYRVIDEHGSAGSTGCLLDH